GGEGGERAVPGDRPQDAHDEHRREQAARSCGRWAHPTTSHAVPDRIAARPEESGSRQTQTSAQSPRTSTVGPKTVSRTAAPSARPKTNPRSGTEPTTRQPWAVAGIVHGSGAPFASPFVREARPPG